MRPDMKNDRYEISNRFEFCFCLHEKVISGRPENSCMQFPCKILLVHFENKYGREKKHWKTTIIDRYIDTLLLADSSTTSITYKLVMLLIKRRKFLVKLSESILYETDVCFKRKKYRREIWVFWSEHSRKWDTYFVFYVTEHLRHMAYSVIEINICSQDL